MTNARPTLEPLGVCVLCGADLSAQGLRCDHGPVRRGEAGWVAEPAPPLGVRARRVLWALLCSLVPLGTTAFFLTVAFLVLVCSDRVSPPALAGGAVALVLGLICAALGIDTIADGLRGASTRRYRGFSSDGRLSAEGQLAWGRWLGGRGRVKVVEPLVVSGTPVPSSSLLAGEGGARSFSLIRAALMTLALEGWITLRVERERAWGRPAGQTAPNLITSPATELWMQPAAGRGELPWLEGRLLEAIRRVTSGSAHEAAVVPEGNGSPYRQASPADLPPPPAEGWATLGEVLRAFFRQERAQPFHHVWLRSRVIGGGLGEPRLGSDFRWLEQRVPELARLLSAAAQRRAMTRPVKRGEA